MASEIFIDTGGLYAALDPRDERHARVQEVGATPAYASANLVTTDYVLDETITLLLARGLSHLISEWLDGVFASSRIMILWMDPLRFDEVRQFFERRLDKRWSFTDCFSFCVMQQRKIHHALAHDEHFRHAGFAPLLRSD